MPEAHKMLHSPSRKPRVIHRFIALKAAETWEDGWTNFFCWVRYEDGITVTSPCPSGSLGQGLLPAQFYCATLLFKWVLTHICSPRGLVTLRELSERHPETGLGRQRWPAHHRSAANRTMHLTFRLGYPSWPHNFAHLHLESCSEIAWLNKSFRRSCNLAWGHQEMEGVYEEFSPTILPPSLFKTECLAAPMQPAWL